MWQCNQCKKNFILSKRKINYKSIDGELYCFECYFALKNQKQ
jgi:hypothetical protein